MNADATPVVIRLLCYLWVQRVLCVIMIYRPLELAEIIFFPSDMLVSHCYALNFANNTCCIIDQVSYKPGKADTPFAKKYGHLAGAQIRTVAEAFSQFTEMLGTPVNALYKGMCSDLVGSLHLIVVNARFNKDPLFSLGLVAALDLVLKNYPEQDTAKMIKTAIIESVGLSEADIDAEAAKLEEWAKGKTQDDISNALKGEGDSPLADIAKAIKGEEWWMYSKFFGIGLVRLMEIVGVEQDMSVAYDVMENWVGKCLEKPYYTACVSSSLRRYIFHIVRH